MKSSLSPLESSLLSLAGTGRNGRIVARHFGLDGRGGANFQVVGDELGLTRERVRQILAERPIKECNAGGARELERAATLIAASLPARAADVEKKLQRAGITAQLFRLEGIVHAAGLLHYPLSFSIRKLGSARYVVGQEFPSFVKIRSIAQQKVRQAGMACVSELLSPGRDAEAARRERSMVQEVLLADHAFRWLDRSAEWFWFSEARGNLALRRIRKMLSVANPLKMRDLQAGLARMSNTPLPDHALLALCKQTPGITVRGDSIGAAPRISPVKVLNGTERAIFRTLSERGGWMSNSELISRANDLGIKRPTFYQCVNDSPIVSRYGGCYWLIGSRRQAEESAAEMPKRRDEAALLQGLMSAARNPAERRVLGSR